MRSSDEHDKHERCPVCEMPLEDSELCNYCEWRSVDNEETKQKTLNEVQK